MGAAESTQMGGSLSKAEVERVKRRFERQAGKSGRMSLEDFKNVPELSGNAFVTRIFQLSDKDRDGYISMDDFVGAVDSLGRIFSEEEKLKFAFTLYDLDGDGFLSMSDLTSILKGTAKGHANALRIEMAAASLLQEYDADRDGQLSYPEFRQLAAGGGQEARPFLG